MWQEEKVVSTKLCKNQNGGRGLCFVLRKFSIFYFFIKN